MVSSVSTVETSLYLERYKPLDRTTGSNLHRYGSNTLVTSGTLATINHESLSTRIILYRLFICTGSGHRYFCRTQFSSLTVAGRSTAVACGDRKSVV